MTGDYFIFCTLYSLNEMLVSLPLQTVIERLVFHVVHGSVGKDVW